MAETRQPPEEPVVHHGHLRAAERWWRDRERTVRNLPAETAILKSAVPRRLRPEVRFAVMHAHRDRFSVPQMCQGLSLSRRSGSRAVAPSTPRRLTARAASRSRPSARALATGSR